MAFLHLLFQVFVSAMSLFLLYALWKVVVSFWISPNRVYQRIRRSSLGGPPPSFRLGNIDEMKRDKGVLLLGIQGFLVISIHPFFHTFLAGRSPMVSGMTWFRVKGFEPRLYTLNICW